MTLNDRLVFKGYPMKTIIVVIMVCVAVASGIKNFSATTTTMQEHNKQVEVAMASMER